MVYLIAGDYRQALHYARQKNLGENWRYVYQGEQLQGLADPLIIRIGTWHTNTFIDEVLDVVDERGFEILDSKF